MERSIKRILYLLFDFVMSFGVWLLFAYARRDALEGYGYLDKQQFINATVIGCYWLVLYAIAGLYGDPLRKSRLKDIVQIAEVTALGGLIIFFSIFLNDPVPTYKTYLLTFTAYLGLQFTAVNFPRLIITTHTNRRIRKRIIGLPTIIIGSGDRAWKIYQELMDAKRAFGYLVKGYVSMPNQANNCFYGKLKHYGEEERLEEIIEKRKIEEVIIALEEEESEQVGALIEKCAKHNVNIKVAPGSYDYIVGTVKISHILGVPLIAIFPRIMTPWQMFTKRVFDLAFASTALFMLSPIYLALILAVKLDSRGPAFYKQERIGIGGKPFFIYKFRSMRIDAEKFGPALSKDNDPRITRVGRVLRKLRLDELPQFWNVIKGDMSIVGPRPERQFFIDQIVQRAPHYRHLHKVRPGITSWGQVRYGYAENVNEMIERLKYDILYMENMSLVLDLKIIIYTVVVMVEGRGK